jgi:hypothetical protein
VDRVINKASLLKILEGTTKNGFQLFGTGGRRVSIVSGLAQER